MRKYLLLCVCFLVAMENYAQRKDFTYKFYGQIRTDLYYNSRANEETVDGLFYLYPKDKICDANGNDINATANSSFYTLYTRLGLDLTGPQLGKAKTSAKIEMDFRGSGNSFSTVRLRHAYLNLDWNKSSLLMGQTWHPLFGDVFPQILNLSVGAPFQPFSRAPQIRYRYKAGKYVRLTGAAIWQSQYASIGLGNNKSTDYIKYGCVPEFYVGIDYKNAGWLVGAGLELLSIKPRTVSNVKSSNGIAFKVDERITTLSYEVHMRYTNKDWFIGAKSVFGSNLTQTSMLGGFGITSIDKHTGEQNYTAFRNSSSWVNIVYGQKWKPGIFIGYVKNLGTKESLISSEVNGRGMNLDQLLAAGAELTYHLPHWKFGVEYTLSTAWYGNLNMNNGKIDNTHSVSNNRIVAVAMFMF